MMDDSLLRHGLFFTGVLLALAAMVVIAVNYSTLYINHHNKQHGGGKHHSMIFLVPQVLLILAAVLFEQFPVYSVSGWLVLIIALLDPSIWVLVSLPFVRSRKR
jgi:hypothetical protein